MAPDLLMPDGRNIASVLARIGHETSDETYPRGELTSIRNALTTLVPGIRDVQVRYDETERRHRIEFVTSDGLAFSARVASDGTLRMLALVAMVRDPRCPGVICFEEPENGVHKARLVTLVDILRQSCTDPSQVRFESDEPLRQILLNTHSPVVAGSLVPHKHDIVVAESITRQKDGHSGRRTAMRACKTASQGALPLPDGVPTLSDYEIGQLADKEDASAT
jgi:predicted ATPase